MPPDVEVLIGHGDGGDHFFSKGIGGQKFEVWAGGENEAVANPKSGLHSFGHLKEMS